MLEGSYWSDTSQQAHIVCACSLEKRRVSFLHQPAVRADARMAGYLRMVMRSGLLVAMLAGLVNPLSLMRDMVDVTGADYGWKTDKPQSNIFTGSTEPTTESLLLSRSSRSPIISLPLASRLITSLLPAVSPRFNSTGWLQNVRFEANQVGRSRSDSRSNRSKRFIMPALPAILAAIPAIAISTTSVGVGSAVTAAVYEVKKLEDQLEIEDEIEELERRLLEQQESDQVKSEQIQRLVQELELYKSSTAAPTESESLGLADSEDYEDWDSSSEGSGLDIIWDRVNHDPRSEGRFNPLVDIIKQGNSDIEGGMDSDVEISPEWEAVSARRKRDILQLTKSRQSVSSSSKSDPPPSEKAVPEMSDSTNNLSVGPIETDLSDINDSRNAVVGDIIQTVGGPADIDDSRDRRNVVSTAVQEAKEVFDTFGSVKDFIVRLARPIVRSLHRNNKRAVGGMMRRMLPYTGLHGHQLSGDVEQHVANGNVERALEVFNSNRVGLKFPPPPGATGVFKHLARLLPLIDNVLKERISSSNAVQASYMGALFGQIRNNLHHQYGNVTAKVETVLSKVSKVVADVQDDYGHVDRLVTLILELVILALCIWILLAVRLARQRILSRMERLLRVAIRVHSTELDGPQTGLTKEKEPLVQAGKPAPAAGRS